MDSIFKSEPRIIRVSSYDERIFRDIVDLANNSFGNGYMSLESLKSMYGARTSLYVALDEGILLGYALNYIGDFNDVAKRMKLPQDVVRQLDPYAKQVCYVKSEAIGSKYRGMSLGEQLSVAALKDSHRLGADSAICAAWKIGDKIPMDSIFIRAGFKKITEIPNLWYDDEDYTCVICKGRCTCVAAIYFMRL